MSHNTLVAALETVVAYMEKISSDPDLYHAEMMRPVRAALSASGHQTVEQVIERAFDAALKSDGSIKPIGAAEMLRIWTELRNSGNHVTFDYNIDDDTRDGLTVWILCSIHDCRGGPGYFEREGAGDTPEEAFAMAYDAFQKAVPQPDDQDALAASLTEELPL